MNKRIIFDEYGVAQDLIISGLPKKIEYVDLVMAAKLYRYWEFSEKEIYNELVRLCSYDNPKFNEVKFHNFIDRAVKVSKKFDFKKVVTVIISKKEMEVIKRFNYRYAKILFTMLVVAKFDKYNLTMKKNRPLPLGYVCNYDIKTIFRFASVKATLPEMRKFTNVMDQQNGLISASNCGKHFFLSFVDDCIDSEPIVIIDKYDDIYEYLPNWCEKCGKEIEKTSNRQKYCEKCKKNIFNEQVRENMRKMRNKML